MTEGDGRHHVLLAGRTLQLNQDAFTDIRMHVWGNQIVSRAGVSEVRSVLKV